MSLFVSNSCGDVCVLKTVVAEGRRCLDVTIAARMPLFFDEVVEYCLIFVSIISDSRFSTYTVRSQ